MSFNIRVNDENVRPIHPNILHNSTAFKPVTTKTSMISKKTMVSKQEILKPHPVNNKPIVKDEVLLGLIMKEVNVLTHDLEKIENIERTLKETNKELPKFHLFQHGDSMTLYRGCRPDQMAVMLVSGTAGGLDENPNTGKPSEEAAVDQVSERKSLPEFTRSLGVTKQFGKGNIMTAFSIKKSHLTQGSVAESGMVCNPDAPIKIIAWREGLPFESKDKLYDTFS